MGNLGRFFSLKYHDELSYSTTKHKFKEFSEDSKNSRNQEITLLSTNYNFEYLTFCRRAFSSHWLTFKVYLLVFHFLSFIYSSSRSIYFFVQDPKPLEVYSADFVIDGPQLGFLGNVSSSFSFSLFFQFFFACTLWRLLVRIWVKLNSSEDNCLITCTQQFFHYKSRSSKTSISIRGQGGWSKNT